MNYAKYDCLTDEQYDVAEYIAKMFEYAIKTKMLDLQEFSYKFLFTRLTNPFNFKSNIWKKNFDEIIDLIENDDVLDTIGWLPIKEGCYDDSNSMAYCGNMGHWFGYLVVSWLITDSINGYFLMKNYKMETIFNDYERFHCLSITVAIEEIKKYYKINSDKVNE